MTNDAHTGSDAYPNPADPPPSPISPSANAAPNTPNPDTIPITAPDGRMLFGGDYNYEQWPESTWDRDLDLLEEAGVNELTLNVFGWSGIQPDMHTYDFSRLDRMIECAERHGMSIEMATATAAMPLWLSRRFEEVNRVDFEGRRQRHGKRQNFCPNSPVYLSFAQQLVERLAQRYAGRDSIVAWHANNEYEGMCYCPNCAAAFRAWLADRYGTIEAVNEAWNAAFWSHTASSFDEIEPPNALSDAFTEDMATLPGAMLDYKRFFSDAQLAEFSMEKRAIRQYDPTTPVTTNFFGRAGIYDYAKWADELDVAAWDCYVGLMDSLSDTSFWHARIRGLKGGQPFVLMEQTPAKQCWFNALQLPGQMRRQSYQALAHGADTVQFFQLKRSRGGCEQFHGAVIGLDESDRPRTFREIAALGEELKSIGGEIVGSRITSRVAVIYDQESRWAMNDADGHWRINDYYNAVREYYAAFRAKNIAVDVVPPTADLTGYDVVAAPYLYIVSDETARNLDGYVARGGRLILTLMSGLATPPDLLFIGEAPVPFRRMTGIWSEELDRLDDGMTIPIALRGPLAGAASAAGAAEPAAGRTLCDIVHADPDVTVLAEYDGDAFYAGTPAITAHDYGNGTCYYVATKPNDALMGALVDLTTDGLGIERFDLPRDVELSTRTADDGTAYSFLISARMDTVEIGCPFDAWELLGQRRVAKGDRLTVKPFDVLILKH